MFPAFICANNIESLVNNLFGGKVFNPVLVFFLSGGFNFTLSAIFSCDRNRIVKKLEKKDIIVPYLSKLCLNEVKHYSPYHLITFSSVPIIAFKSLFLLCSFVLITFV